MLKRKEFILGAAAGLIVAAGATAGGVISWPGAHAETRPGQLVASAGAAGLAFAPPQGAPLSFADIVQQVAPAVVQIEVETPVERPQGVQGFQIPGLPGLVIPGPGQQQQAEPDAEPQLAQGAGSGFFISRDGYIVTNNHVVANAKSIKVKMTDGRTLDATLVGRDESTDLAVIKVDGSDFNFVSFEEQADPRVGDWVVAVGNPFGLGGTATAGIVSARGRDLQDRSSAYVDYLQIDAAINRGNSGGPTFDIYGRVIGVNSAIFSPTGGSVGIGFAIPAATAKSVTDQLIRSGAIERGYIGVQIGNLTDDYRSALGLGTDAKGALVQGVTDGGPADRGGVREGDVIVAVNGQAVETSNALTRAVGAVSVGSDLRIELFRDGRRQTVTVKSAKRPSEAELYPEDDEGNPRAPTPGPTAPSGLTVEGINLSPLTPALKRRYSLADDLTAGLVVTEVAPRSKAGELGMPAGTVITKAFGRTVTTPQEFKAAVDAARAAGRTHVLLSVVVNGSPRLVPLELSKAE
ncbi:Do family serine endopeptidase [Brevundimonas goettingensis]|uniref:Do family serine endopeptidase n=1 Tax=Brevundimonas goettingensis TaxID=2774190 RepID=A0A975C0E1_9CAUL|nr:Do family serine endopeptidase [Brevundimonas goettingensis]QTC91411.1 Do family serine endopeptidase [Brevundimonas goettingensis]